MARQVIPLCDDEQLEEIKQAFVNATGEPLGWGPKRLIVNDRVSASALDPLSHRIAVALASGRLQVIDFRINRTIMTYNSPELADDDFFVPLGIAIAICSRSMAREEFSNGSVIRQLRHYGLS